MIEPGRDLWVLLVLGVVMWKMGKKRLPRGIRNNNPGNIRHSADKWEGMRATQTDPAFVQFVAPEYGIRALVKLLISYRSRYGLNTVAGIINRWAPPVENETGAYVAAVASALGVDPAAAIDVEARALDLAQAIIKHENGMQPYTMAQLERGASLAGVVV